MGFLFSSVFEKERLCYVPQMEREITGDYTWNNPRQPIAGKLRPLRRSGNS